MFAILFMIRKVLSKSTLEAKTHLVGVTLCGMYNKGEVLNAIVEFSGPGIESLSIDERMTISNMTTEWGALAGWFQVDDQTINYLKKRKRILELKGIERFTDSDLEDWRTDPPLPDEDASYAARIEMDLDRVSPHVSGPDSVQVMHSLQDIEKDRVQIQKAYLVSCVNSRLSDLQAAAKNWCSICSIN